MEKKTIEVEVWIASDGRKFENEKICEQYELKIELLEELLVENLKNNYYVVYIKPEMLKTSKGKIIENFNVNNPNKIKEGWNLIHDSNNGCSTFFPITEMMEKLAEKQVPLNPPKEGKVDIVTTEETQTLVKVKQRLMQIIASPSQMQGASPEGVMGNIILQLQDLVSSI